MELERRLKQIDVIYVEDERLVSDLMTEFFEIQGWNYIHVNTLIGLADTLETHQAKVYIFDGNFPAAPGRGSNPNAFKAYDLVIGHSLVYCYSPSFILHTTDDRFKELADQSNIKYFDKVERQALIGTVADRLAG